MHDDHGWVILGQFGRVHGVRGMIKVISYTEHPEDIFSYPHWFIHANHSLSESNRVCGDGKWSPVELLNKELTHQHLLVKIKGYDSREKAALLTRCLIGVMRDQLPPVACDEFYCFELVGMNVVNTQKRNFGKVVQVLQTGANDVLIVQGEKRVLIPFLKEKVIKQISRDDQLILVEWNDEFL